MNLQPSRDSYDVVIVGGAVIGSAAAYFLASNPDFRGTILVVERDWTYARCATALSSSSIRHQFSNPVNVRMSQFGSAFIKGFNDQIGGDAEPSDLSFKENGYLFLASNDVQREILTSNHATQIRCGATVALLEPETLAGRFRWLSVEGLILGSYGESGEGWFDNMGLLQGLRRKARQLGAEYVQQEVIGVNVVGDRVRSVRLAGGASIACGVLVNASGTRGRLVAGMAGLDIPVEPRKRSLFVVSCPTKLEGVVPLTIDPTGVFFRPEGELYLMGTYPKYDPQVDFDDFDVRHDEFIEEIWPVVAERVPAFEALRVVNSWAGHYDYCMLDHNAIIGPHPVVRNFLFANGFSGHGLQQAPAVGRGLSEVIVYGGFRALDLSALGYERVAANRPFLETSVI